MFRKSARFSFKNSLPGKIIPSPLFTLRYGMNNEGLKVAVVVSKKVDKRAVVRNKIKRRVLKFVRKTANINESLNLIFYMRRAAIESNSLESEIERTIKQIK